MTLYELVTITVMRDRFSVDYNIVNNEPITSNINHLLITGNNTTDVTDDIIDVVSIVINVFWTVGNKVSNTQNAAIDEIYIILK